MTTAKAATKRRKAPPRIVVLRLTDDQAHAVMTACETYAEDPGAALGDAAEEVRHTLADLLFGEAVAKAALRERATRRKVDLAKAARELDALAGQVLRGGRKVRRG